MDAPETKEDAFWRALDQGLFEAARIEAGERADLLLVLASRHGEVGEASRRARAATGPLASLALLHARVRASDDAEARLIATRPSGGNDPRWIRAARALGAPLAAPPTAEAPLEDLLQVLGEGVRSEDPAVGLLRAEERAARVPAPLRSLAEAWVTASAAVVGLRRVRPGQAGPLVIQPDATPARWGATALDGLRRSALAAKLFVEAAISGDQVDRQGLYERVWSEAYRPPSSDDRLYMAISRLRRLLPPEVTVDRSPTGAYGVAPQPAVYQGTPTPVRQARAAPSRGLVGRDALLQQLLAIPPASGLCLVGLPGVGKSALIAVAAPAYAEAHGLDWRPVALRHVRDEDALRRALVAALDLPAPLDPDDAVTQALATRGPTLLVLDDADGCALGDRLAAWCREAPDLVVWATARQAVASLPPLRVDPLDPSDAAALYVKRCQGSHGDTPVSDLMTLLDGLPLAIELAAARSRLISPAELTARLRVHGHRLLGGLHAVVEEALDALPPELALALAQLTAFAGTFDLDAAEAVIRVPGPAPWAGDLLEALLERALVQPFATPDGVRFALPHVVAQVASERGGEAAIAAIQRHAQHYAALGEPEVRRRAYRSGGVAFRRRTLRDLDQVLAAFDRVSDDDVRARLGVAAIDLLLFTGPLTAAVTMAERALLLNARPLARSRVSLAASIALRTVGLGGRAREAVQLAVAEAVRAGDPVQEAHARAFSAEVARWHGDVDGAARELEAAAGLIRDEDAPDLRATLDQVWGLTFWERAPEEAIARLLMARDRYRELGDRRNEGQLESVLGAMWIERGASDRASNALESALRAFEEVSDRRGQGLVLNNLSVLAALAGRVAEARAHAERALSLHQALGARRSIAVTRGNLGELCRRQGDLEAALVHARAALALSERLEDRGTLGVHAALLGELEAESGLAVAGANRLDQALALLEGVGPHADLVWAQIRRARVYRAAGDARGAAAAIDRALEVADGAHLPPEAPARQEALALRGERGHAVVSTSRT